MDEKTDELTAVIAEIRDRVRTRNPNGMAAGYIPLPDMTPLVHARDAAPRGIVATGADLQSQIAALTAHIISVFFYW